MTSLRHPLLRGHALTAGLDVAQIDGPRTGENGSALHRTTTMLPAGTTPSLSSTRRRAVHLSGPTAAAIGTFGRRPPRMPHGTAAQHDRPLARSTGGAPLPLRAPRNY